MKNFQIIYLLLALFFFSCENNPTKSTSSKEKSSTEITSPQPQKSTKKIPLPSEAGGVNYWVDNSCTRPIPAETILPEHQINGYEFKLNSQQGYGKETMQLDNDYKLDVTSKGCNSIVITYAYFLPKIDLDISNESAVSKKTLELIKMTTKISSTPIDIKSKIPALEMVSEQIGPFKIGKEFILTEEGGTQKFSLERLETKNNKVFLTYYFSKDL